MKYVVTNGSRNHRAIFTKDKPAGHHVPVGATVEIEMTESEADNAMSPGVIVERAVDKAEDRKVEVKKVGQKFAVFINEAQHGQPMTKAQADAEAAKASG